MPAAHVYDAVRTPFGRLAGALSRIRPDDLAAGIIGALMDRHDLDPAEIDEVTLGDANGAGEDNRNVARMASLLAGFPVSVPGSTVNRLCGSGLDAAMGASRMIETGDAELVIAGGVESMSRAPWVLPKPARGFEPGHLQAVSTTLGWRLVNEKMPAEWTASLGECNEMLGERYGISRERQDAFAMDSHQRADQAWNDGHYDHWTFPVADAELTRDEGIRADTSAEKLAKLKPAFHSDGSITAGNASPLNDGAAAVLLGSSDAGKRHALTSLGRIAGRAAHAVDPRDFGYAPVEAANKALRQAGIGWDDVTAVELNEAFAVQSIACVDAWGIDPEIVNAWGGAIAIGHPLGASGGRILGTLAHRLQDADARWGVATICIGVGQGLAVVLENESAGHAA